MGWLLLAIIGPGGASSLGVGHRAAFAVVRALEDVSFVNFIQQKKLAELNDFLLF